MKGRVLGYDRLAEVIIVRGDDGRRYRFVPADWREPTPPRKGDEVDFESDGERARAVFLIGTGAAAVPAAGPTPAATLARVPMLRMLLERPVVPTALLVLFACVLGTYHVDGQTVALVAVPELIGGFSKALDGLVQASGANPAPRLAAGATRVAMVALIALYIVPALAGLAFWREFTGRADQRIARLAGLAAMTLPIVLPLLVVLLVRLWVAPGIDEVTGRLGRGGFSAPFESFDVLRLFATGTMFLVLSGVALWTAATGRLRLDLEPVTDTRPAVAPPQPGHRDYAPPGSRPSAPGSAPPAPSRSAANGAGHAPPPELSEPAPPASPRTIDAAMDVLTEELRATIGSPRRAADPAAGPASAPPPGQRRRQRISTGDLPPLSGSVWPTGTPRGPRRDDRSSD